MSQRFAFRVATPRNVSVSYQTLTLRGGLGMRLTSDYTTSVDINGKMTALINWEFKNEMAQISSEQQHTYFIHWSELSQPHATCNCCWMSGLRGLLGW